MEANNGKTESIYRGTERVSESLHLVLPALIAATSSQIHSLRYASELQITPQEWKRYLGKSAYLAFCNAGFVQNISIKQASGAGKAAFLFCAYDVCSDWREKNEPRWAKTFEKIVRCEASPQLAEAALSLYQRDIDGELTQDGLERGIVALRFVLEMMGLQSFYEQKVDVNKLGTLLQIIDDVLDYEKDILAGDENCLTSARRNDYLRILVEEFDDIQNLFPYGGALLIAIKKSREKAQHMLLQK